MKVLLVLSWLLILAAASFVTAMTVLVKLFEILI